MVYNDLKEKVKSFLKPFAETGKPVGAEDVKEYFEKLRGDAEAVKAAKMAALREGEDNDGDNRREQSGKHRKQPVSAGVKLTYNRLLKKAIFWSGSNLCLVHGYDRASAALLCFIRRTSLNFFYRHLDNRDR